MIDILYSHNNKRITEISNIEVKEDGPLMGLETKIKRVNLQKGQLK